MLLLLAAGAGFASDLSQPFDGAFSDWRSTGPSTVGQWLGDGTVVEIAPKSASPIVGSPVSASDNKSLLVDGAVVCTNTTGQADSRFSQTEMLVRFADKFDSMPDAADLGDVQMAIVGGTNYVAGTGNMVPVYAYCVPKGGTATNWVEVGAVPTNVWARITVISDYASGLSKICVDGLPSVTASGYLTTNKAHQTEVDGSWYGIPAATAKSAKVQSIKFRGVAHVDDVVVSQTDEPDFGAYATNVLVVGERDGSGDPLRAGVTNVNYTLLAKWGVVERTIEQAMLDDTGLTVSQKLEVGLDPLGGEFLQQTAMTRDDTAHTITVFFNSTSEPGWHRFVLTDAITSDVYTVSYDPVKADEPNGTYAWYIVDPSGEKTSAEVSIAEPVEGVRSATIRVPDALQTSRSLKIDVKAVAGKVVASS